MKKVKITLPKPVMDLGLLEGIACGLAMKSFIVCASKDEGTLTIEHSSSSAPGDLEREFTPEEI